MRAVLLHVEKAAARGGRRARCASGSAGEIRGSETGAGRAGSGGRGAGCGCGQRVASGGRRAGGNSAQEWAEPAGGAGIRRGLGAGAGGGGGERGMRGCRACGRWTKTPAGGAAARIWLASEATDMRCGFDRLAERVRTVIGEDPLSGHLFIFRSRRGDRLEDFDVGPRWICFVVQTPRGGRFQAAARRRVRQGGGTAGQRAGDDSGRDRCVAAEAPAALPAWGG
jgi:hypothetical protein